jgi:hypothetical protein
MSTERLFKVSISDPLKTHGVTVHLPVPRTQAQIDRLREKYAVVTSTQTSVDLDAPSDFNVALNALVRLYKASEAKGDHALAHRAEAAVGELLKEQKHLRDPDPPARRKWTLIGLGGGRS